MGTQLQLTTLSTLQTNFKPIPSRCSSPPSLLSSLPLPLPAPHLSRPARSTHPAQLLPRVTTSGRSPTSSDASLREPTPTALPRPISLRTTSSTLAARTASSTSLSQATVPVCIKQGVSDDLPYVGPPTLPSYCRAGGNGPK